MIEVQMHGVRELVKRLDALKYEARYKGGRFALRKAAQLVRKAAQQNASRIDDPETAANIAANITERWGSKIYARTGNLAFRVGVLGGAGIRKTQPKGTRPGGPGGDTRHWFYVEFGKENMRAQPFLRPALAQNAQAATDEFIRQFNKVLDKAIKKGLT